MAMAASRSAVAAMNTADRLVVARRRDATVMTKSTATVTPCSPARLITRAAPRPTAAKNSTGSVVSRPAVAIVMSRVSWTWERTPPRPLIGTRNDIAGTTRASSGSHHSMGRDRSKGTELGCWARTARADWRVPVSGTQSANRCAFSRRARRVVGGPVWPPPRLLRP